MRERPTVFISFCRADQMLEQRLVVHLGLLKRQGLLDLWDESRIRRGMDRRREIEKAIKRAKVAVLIISADYLATDSVVVNELERLLEQQREKGLQIIPILAKPCIWQEVAWLSRMFDPNETALSAHSPDELEQYLAGIAKEVLASLNTSGLPEEHSEVLEAKNDPKAFFSLAIALTSTGLMIQWSGISGGYLFAIAIGIASVITVAVMTAGWFAVQWMNTLLGKVKSGTVGPLLVKLLGGAATTGGSMHVGIGIISITAVLVGGGSGILASAIAEPVSKTLGLNQKPDIPLITAEVRDAGADSDTTDANRTGLEMLDASLEDTGLSQGDHSATSSGQTGIQDASPDAAILCEDGGCSDLPCKEIREPCDNEQKCCKALKCFNKKCCVKIGNKCKNDFDCCNGTICYKGKCDYE